MASEEFDFLLSSSSLSPTETSSRTMSDTAKTSLATLRTFDSNDDLLQSDGEEERGSDQPDDPMLKHSRVWDCKAVHVPPHSFKLVTKAGYKYIQSLPLICEVLFLGVFVGLCYFLPAYLVPAHHRPIPIQTTADGNSLIDLTFANDYHPNETIPGYLLNILCVGIPIGLFALMGVFMGPPEDFHAALCSYLLAMGMKIFIVACIKLYAGYLRPSFYNMCQYNPETHLCDDETTSARESFPSGHAATALSSMTLVALFLLGKVRGGTRQRGVKRARDDPVRDAAIWSPSLLSKLLAVLAVSPVGLGMFIATSRVRDNWHHPADVVCGGIIGASCALFAHSLWYPSVHSSYAGIPLSTAKAISEARRAKDAAIIDLEDNSQP